MFKKSSILFLGALILVFTTLRFYRLPQKMYWLDEVASPMRAAGITGDELTWRIRLLSGQVATARDLISIIEPSVGSCALDFPS